MPHFRFSHFFCLSLLALAWVWVSESVASQPVEPFTAVAPVALADRPYEIASLGLTVRLPLGATLNTQNIGATNASFTVSAKDHTWLIRLHSPESRDKTLTPPRVVEGLLAEISKTRTGKDPVTGKMIAGVNILDRQDSLLINGVTASRFYSSVPRSDGSAIVSGYTVFPIAPGRFAVFQLDCMAPEFDKARAIYETVVATVHIKDALSVAAGRAAGVLAGDRLLKHFNFDDLVSMLPHGPVFYRLYNPGKTGMEGDDTEVAYEVIEMKQGHRGDLKPRVPPSRWLAADQEPGIVVSVKARFLDGSRTIDSESIYFLSNNRTSESWSTHMAVKRGKDAALFTETGARHGDTIDISIVQPAQPQINKSWKTPPEGYLSQVETYLLPMLLTRLGAEADFAFYTYQTQRNDIMLRRDRLEKTETPGQWRILTRTTEDASVDTTIVDQDGLIVRKIMATGVVMEAIKPERLMKLWKSKGLPTE